MDDDLHSPQVVCDHIDGSRARFDEELEVTWYVADRVCVIAWSLFSQKCSCPPQRRLTRKEKVAETAQVKLRHRNKVKDS